MNALFNQLHLQMLDTYLPTKYGYKNLNSNSRLHWPLENQGRKTINFGREQAFATSLSIAVIASVIFRLIGATSIPSLTLGVAAGLVTFAHQCYIYGNQHKRLERQGEPQKSTGLYVYYKSAEFFNKAERAAHQALAKCQALWNAQKKDPRVAG